MILMIVRLIFGITAGLAALTGAPSLAPFMLISGGILFFTDGGFVPLIVYAIIGLVLVFLGSFLWHLVA